MSYRPNTPPQRAQKNINFPLSYNRSGKKGQPKVVIKTRQLKKPGWNESTTVNKQGLFDPKMNKNIVRNQKYQMQTYQPDEQEQVQHDDTVYQKLAVQKEDRSQDVKHKTQQILQEKMERERRVYESYHTLSQIQELTNKENARKNANILGKEQKELKHLRWMIEQEDQKKQENDKIQQERYAKLLEQKQLNLSLKKQIVDQKKQQTSLVYKRNAHIEQSQPPISVQDEHPAAEYIEGMVWENDPRPVVQGVMNIHDTGNEQQNDGKSNRVFERYKKQQKVVNEQVQTDINIISIQMKNRQKQLDDLLLLHKAQMDRDRELRNRHFQGIEQRVNKLKGVIDPLEEKMRIKDEEDKYKGNFAAKAAAQMIMTYNEQITELLINDLLYEMVGILQEVEDKDKKKNQSIKRQAVVYDYIEEFKELIQEQNLIEDRVRIKYKAYDLYEGPTAKQRKYLANPLFTRCTGLELGMGQMVNILENRNKFSESLYKLSHYSRKNLDCFRLITEELIDEILEEEARNLDKTNSEFAQAIFENEFK